MLKRFEAITLLSLYIPISQLLSSAIMSKSYRFFYSSTYPSAKMIRLLKDMSSRQSHHMEKRPPALGGRFTFPSVSAL